MSGWHRIVPIWLLGTAAAMGGPPPPGSAVQILAPRFFPGWQAQNVCYPFVVPDASAGGYRMYYAGSSSTQVNESLWDQWVTGYVTSSDTQKWAFPENYEQVLFARKLYEGEVVDPQENAGIFDSIFATGACVLIEGGTYRCWYTGWNGEFEQTGGGLCTQVHFRIGYATSPDGIAWTKHPGSAGAGSIVGLGDAGQGDAKGAAHPHVLKVGGTYRMWYEGFDGTTWRIMHATSPDGVTWTKQGVVLEPGGAGSRDQLGLRNPLVLQRGGQYELWYQGQGTSAPNFRVLRATSPDGVTWTKAAGEVALHPTPAVSGDERILVDSAIVLGDGSVQVFFARQTTKTQSLTYGGTLRTRHYHLYTETVNP